MRLRRFLLLLCSLISVSSLLQGNDLYWVGGSGDFNDPQHWSLVSGGSSSGLVPSVADDVIFDENSGAGSPVNIFFGGNAFCHSLSVTDNYGSYVFTNAPGITFKVGGSFKTSLLTEFKFTGMLEFNSSETDNKIVMNGNQLACEIIFNGTGTWKPDFLFGRDHLKITHNSGTLIIDKAGIKCREFISNGGTIKLEKGLIRAYDFFEVKSQTTVQANKGSIQAPVNDAAKYKVPSAFSASPGISVSNAAVACDFADNIVATFTTCSNNCSGLASISFSGCTAVPYYAEWYLGSLQFTAYNINSSPYNEDSLCCSSTSYGVVFYDSAGVNVDISQVSVTCPAAPLVIRTVVTPTCNDSCDGEVRINIAGTYMPFTVNYMSPPPTSLPGYPKTGVISKDTLYNVCADTLTLTVANSIGCVTTQTFVVTEPLPVLPNATINNVTCYDSCNGSIVLNPTGGNGGFTYSWSNPPGFSTSNTISNLCAGVSYTCAITDSKGCPGTFTGSVTQPPEITFTTSQVNPLCGDVCNGTATISGVTGGYAPYSFSWAPAGTASNSGANSSTGTGLCPGSGYTVTVTDTVGCYKTASYNITGPTTITSSVTITNVACNGDSTGSVVGSASGGTGPYTFCWLGASGSLGCTNPVTGLPAGTYSLVSTGVFGCDDTISFTITEPTALSATLTTTNPVCAGVCSGSITTAVAGGVGPYTFIWSPTLTGQNPVNVCADDYTLTLQDANSCQASFTVSITQPPPITFSLTTTNPSCANASDGSANVTTSGGTGTVTAQWGDCASCGFPRTGMAAGTYTVIATDGTSCTDTFIFTLTEPVALSASVTTTSVTCSYLNNGSATATVSGGTMPYSYSWDTNPGSSIQTGLSAGAHTLVVTDANNCTVSVSFTIASPPPLTATATSTNPDCFNQCNGTANGSAVGGTGAINYFWLPIGQSSPAITNLCAGTYSLVATDGNSCKDTFVVTITTPPSLTLTPTSTDVTCAGACNGTASAAVAGGTPGYTVTWTPGGTGISLSNLCPNTYNVSVQDANGCTTSSSVTITQPNALSVSLSNLTASCPGNCSGAATASASGGVGGYVYSWSGGQSGQNPTNLCPGSGTVTVTDLNSCSASSTFTVVASLVVSITSTGTTLNCFNDCNAVATANATGGAGTLTYSWTPTNQSTSTATGLCAGTHIVSVTDTSGCVNSDTIVFVNPPQLTVSETVTNESCFNQCNGSASLNIGGGTGATTVTWLPGFQTTTSITNQCSGVYTYTVTDSKNCTYQDSVSIGAANLITATFSSTNPTTCSSSDGCITANPSGGTAPYSYSWNTTPVQTTQTICGLPDGVFTVIVTDFFNCADTITVTLSDPTGPTATVAVTNASCYGYCNGSGTVSASGSGAVNITWLTTPAVSGATANGLCAGTYNISMTDATACTTYTSAVIAEPNALSDSIVVSNATCFAACNGTLDPNISGGTQPYSYTWTPMGSGAPATNLCAGTYSVIVQDALGCADTLGPYIVTQPPAFSVNATATNISCFGLCNGSASASTTGGTNPVSFSWQGPSGFTAVTPALVNLCAGQYTVTATDANGCTTSAIINVTEPPQLVGTLTTSSVLCNGQCNGTGSFPTIGGTGGISFTWLPNPATTQTVNNLCAGAYTVTAQDANGCQDTAHLTITEPLALSATSTFTAPTCYGGNNGSATVNVSGGTTTYVYSWSPNINSSSTAINLSAQIYTVTTTDANGCVLTTNITVTQPTPVLGNYSSTSVTCQQPCSATISTAPTGGAGSYSVSVNPGPSFTNLCTGNYTVTVVDAVGCADSSVITISPPPGLTVATSVTPASCDTPCTGAISVVPTSGTGPYSYNWSNISGSPGSNPTGLCSGIYTVEITDANSCIDTFNIAVSDAAGPDSVQFVISDPSCNGVCDGSIIISQVLSGTGPYTYSWNVTPAVTNDTITGLCDGSYMVTITDASNCSYIPTVTLLEPLQITGTAVVSNATCNGVCDGAITTNVTGGTAPLVYSWTSSTGFTGNQPNILNLCAGTYTLIVTDAKGCTATFTYTVNSNQAIVGTTSVTDLTCPGVCNGTASLNNVNGGIAPYTISWSDPLGQSSAIATGLCAGTYSVTVTDATGCFSVFTATALTEPAAIQSNATVTDASCGTCNGQITMAPSGGTGSYSYVWSNAQTGASASNLCSGVHMVDVTDAAGCVAQFSVGVNNTNAPTLSVTPSNLNCIDSCNGSATVTVSGGLAPYTINWVPGGQTGPVVNGLCAGTYFVQALDANNCTATQSFTIGATSALTVTQSAVQPSCGACNGMLSVTPTGGIGPYTYTWNGVVSNNDTVTGLCAGVYTVSVTDASGCDITQVIALGNSGGPQIAVTPDDVNCNNGADGGATVAISGGTAPYTTVWSSGISAGTSVSGLSAGLYAVTVTDNAGCVTATVFTVSEPNSLALSLNSLVLPSCSGVCNGGMSAIPSGGTLPYTYFWSTGAITPSVTGLCAGSYSVVVIDANGCSASQNTTLGNNPNLISGNPTIADPQCGLCDGTVSLSPSGGSAPYSYSWSDGSSASSITNVCAGVYQVNISDSLGCTTPVYVNISNAGGPQIILTSTPETCSGDNDGTATATVSSGTAPYFYFWVIGGQTTSGITGQGPGSYTVQVQDAMNCVSTASVAITGSLPIQANPLITTPTCGNSDGTITLSPSGGSGSGYTYSWAGGFPPSNTITNIGAGVYTVTITDGSGCSEQIIIPVTNGTVPLVSVDADSVLCNGGATGSAAVTITGGVGPFTTTWSTGAGGTSLSGLTAGNYAVTVVDNSTGCSTSALFDIGEPDTLILSLTTQQQPTCSGAANGALTALPSGGMFPYSFLWLPGNQATAGIASLASGSYTVQVTDANGCTRSQTTNLNNAVNIVTLNPAVNGPDCNQCNGSITLNPSGGNLPLSFDWTNGDTTQNINNVCAGLYQVQVTDSLGCQQTFNVTVSNINGMTSDGLNIVNETCFGSCNGSVTLNPVGGTAPYSYDWIGLPDTTSSLNNLCEGDYFVQITDSNGCILTSQASIFAPSQLLVNPIVGSPNCGASNGSISLMVSGGSVPYSYSWSGGVSTTYFATNLAGGIYVITVSDAAGCSQSFTIALSSVGAPVLADVVNEPTCNGTCNGSITVNPVGGTAPYTYLWSNGNTGNSINGICDTTLSLVVTDGAGCISTASYSISQPQPLQFSIPIVNDPLCFGDTNGVFNVIPSGGTLGYTFSWSPAVAGDTTGASNLAPGTYTFTVTDANGCTATQIDSIVDPPLLVVSSLVTNASCNTVADGAIDLTVSGGTPVYDYNWNTGDSIQDLNNILAGSYSVIVTDFNGCDDTLNFSVIATVFVLAEAGNDTSICYAPDFILDASATTGEAGLTWYDSTGTAIGTTDTVIAPLSVGVNTFYVIAINGACSDSDTIVINNNALPMVDAGPYQTIVLNNSTTIGGNPTGGAGSTFIWTPGGTLSDSTIANPIATPTATTTYTVTVSTPFGCPASDTVTIRVIPQVIFPNGFTPNGDGKNETWIIDNIDQFPECEIEVYNRWGERLFYSRGYKTQWDGNYKGKPLPVGTYYFAIKLNHPLFPDPYTGPITILR